MKLVQVGAGGSLAMFVKLASFDEKTGVGEGILAIEEPDQDNDILDYESSKSAVLDWSNTFQKATGGKSAGNLRVMHTEKVAGRFLTVGADDDSKSFPVTFVVDDEVEKTNCANGNYTGLSLRAKCRGWKDKENPQLRRYTVMKMIEGSLVDNPAIPSARFTLKSAGGTIEQREFNREISQAWVHPGCDIKHGRKDEARGCSGAEVLKAVDATIDTEEILEKCLGCVSSLAYLIQQVTVQRPDQTVTFSDGSGYTNAGHDEMVAGVKQLFDSLRSMVADLRDKWMAEETADGDLDPATMDVARVLGELETRIRTSDNVIKSLRVPSGNGSSNNNDNKEGTMEDKNKPKAPETAAAAAEPTELQKVASLITTISTKLDEISKTAGEVTELKKTVAGLEETVKTLAEAIGNLPVQPKGQVRPVAKLEDGKTDEEKKKSADGKTGNPFIDDVQRIF